MDGIIFIQLAIVSLCYPPAILLLSWRNIGFTRGISRVARESKE
jgi:hypothetical protein